MYATDKGLEELVERRSEETLSYEELAGQLRAFVDLHPQFEVPIERLAVWLARADPDLDD